MWKTIAGATALSLMVVGTAHASQAPNLYERANADGSFKAFVTEVNAAGLSDALKGAGEWTIFAPTDEAFAALPNGTVERLLEPENKDELVTLLKNHIIPGKSFVSQWANGKVATQTRPATPSRLMERPQISSRSTMLKSSGRTSQQQTA
ncbi:MAG: fasciclin domain-containing protein [Methyloceanibacter sp.]